MESDDTELIETELIAMGADVLIGAPLMAFMEKAYRAYSGIKLMSMRLKLERFLASAQAVSDKQRIDFLKSLGDNKKEFTREIFLTIERLDKEDKSAILGNLTAALFLRHLSVDDYQRLCGIVEKTYHKDLLFLYKHHSDPIPLSGRYAEKFIPIVRTPESEFISANLITQGLLGHTWVGILGAAGVDDPIEGFKPTYYGDLLLKYGF